MVMDNPKDISSLLGDDGLIRFGQARPRSFRYELLSLPSLLRTTVTLWELI